MIETPPLQPTPRPFYRNPWLLVGIVALLGVSFFAGYLSVRIHHRHESLQQAVGSIFIPEPQTYFHKDRIRVLVLGIDYNYNDKDEAYSTGARSDTIMALSLNFPTATAPNGSVSILSVPRDTGVTYPGGREDKINTAYATGGVKESEKIVAAFLGLPAFDRYVVLRINALKQVIDAIGGIDVVADETMNYDDTWGHLHIHFIGGKLYHMDGEQAVSYSRFRHDACSDPCRIKRQQQIVRIVLAKLKSDRVNDLIHIRDLLKVVNDNVVTNFRLPEEESIALAMSGLDPNTVRTA
ncbi:MAG: LCP family protein, partial [Vulcanimicrobiaceae bacterium]